ncbi:sigma-54 dependent transcriptional regulator [Acuticoccus sp. M5D2P5]|uniref:sigma-54-dependent transcriptional regulator n=1 Tax=Acuticoccus kalidii TaxID=2910977 RepID=UPI001F293552|nr:sigma-54 dependent transcriptional regulator [Acuticoccus kalidii]MCF3932807.1 sigma-54 dependent transcriptional regulator [Acuticoccus kalidii]
MTGAVPNLLLVEDDEILGASLEDRLSLEGFAVTWVHSAREAARAIRKLRPDIVVCDIRLPDGDGDDVMRDQFQSVGMVPIVFMTAFGSIDQAVRLVREGAWHYITKPFAVEDLIETLNAAVGRTAEVVAQESDPAGSDTTLGVSPAMISLAKTLARVADTDLPVLLLGETGTGKEVAARYLHGVGARAERPFVPVNCGALQADLTESIIFGHEKGAFTGASGAHMGVAEETGEGTLFLDEVGELPLSVQVKLLRLLETGEFRRLGGSRNLAFRGRVVCATNRDLAKMVAEGTFREDLWFRINVVTCTLAPLRERPADIERHLTTQLARAASRFGRPDLALGADALALARQHAWAGNVRELINRVDRAVALCDGDTVGAVDLFPEKSGVTATGEGASGEGAVGSEASLSEVRRAAEREHILRALDRTDGVQSEAAKRLGISRTTLWEKMTRYGLTSRSDDDRT